MNGGEYPIEKLFDAELISGEAYELNHNYNNRGGDHFVDKLILRRVVSAGMAEDRRPVKRSNIYISETSPKNPFGPNYELLDYPTKVGYKFSSLMQFIKLSEEDARYKQMEELRYMGWLLGGLFGGALFAMAIRKYLQFDAGPSNCFGLGVTN